MDNRLTPSKLIFALFFCGLIILSLMPIFWGMLASFRTETALLAYPPTISNFDPTLENYRRIVDGGILVGVRNSLLYAAASVVLGLILGSIAAFGFDRFQFAGKHGLFLIVVASIPLAIGSAALIVPTFLFFTALGFTNQWYTLPIIYGVHSLPMVIWILKGSLEGIPRELDEAAYVDGASSMTVFFQIILPLCKPALAAAGLFLFLHAWNEFLAGSVMVDPKDLKPIQVLIYQYMGFFGREWGAITAASTLAILPVILIYMFFGRMLVSGLTRGSVKG